MNKEFLSVREVAEMKNISVRRVNAIILGGKLSAQKIGNSYVIARADAEALQTYGKPGKPAKEKESAKK